jgi:hypothetical protein
MSHASDIVLYRNIQPITCCIDEYCYKLEHLKKISQTLKNTNLPTIDISCINVSTIAEEQLFLELWDIQTMTAPNNKCLLDLWRFKKLGS